MGEGVDEEQDEMASDGLEKQVQKENQPDLTAGDCEEQDRVRLMHHWQQCLEQQQQQQQQQEAAGPKPLRGSSNVNDRTHSPPTTCLHHGSSGSTSRCSLLCPIVRWVAGCPSHGVAMWLTHGRPEALVTWHLR